MSVSLNKLTYAQQFKRIADLTHERDEIQRKHDDLVITSATVISELQRQVEALAVECHSAKTLLRKIHGESYDSDHEFGKSVYEKDTYFELQDFIENQSDVGTSTPATDTDIAEIKARQFDYAESVVRNEISGLKERSPTLREMGCIANHFHDLSVELRKESGQ